MTSQYLNDHAKADKGHDAFRVSDVPEAAQPRRAGAIASLRLQSESRVCELLLKLGNVQESQVRGVEQSNTQREVDAHEEELNIIGQNKRHGVCDGVGDLRQNPV